MMTTNEKSKLPPGREPLTSDWFAEQLGVSQRKVMGLTVAKRALEKRLERIEARAEVLEELIMDVVADMQDNVLKSVILERINKVMQRLDEDD
jgi:hypothetical protein